MAAAGTGANNHEGIGTPGVARRRRRSRLYGLGAIAVVAFLSACSLEEERPESIPPPETPTSSREAQSVRSALHVYERDHALIRAKASVCSKGLPASAFDRVCGPAVRSLVAQRSFHLRSSLEGLEGRVGPACGSALQRTLAVPVAGAGGPLTRAAEVCEREYSSAIAADRRRK